VRLFFRKPVRRFIGLAALLFIAIPFGMSVSGCKKALAVDYCDAGDSGPQVGQVSTITLSPTLATVGESLSFGQIGQSLSATAYDCKNNQVSVTRFTYATTNMAIADINPSTGSVCAGTWNRNSGGGIQDYTTCTAPATPPAASQSIAYVTASAGGAVSNSIPVYIHPTVTSIVLGNQTTNCSTDPTTTCCPANTTTVYNPVPPVYNQNSCISQNSTAQLVARVYAYGGTTTADNITCQVGHLTFSPTTSTNVVSIDENGVATANQPGSTLIAASVSNSSSASSAGFFSTCPPTSITLSIPSSTSTTATVNLNNAFPLVATVTDVNRTVLTGIALEFESTTPQTTPGGSTVTPEFPGTAAITALCQPASCNPAPFSQIGYLGNGKPIQSNPVIINTPGTSSTVIYMASTQSQYIVPMDFSTGLQSAAVKLPYVPNSMVISLDGSVLYFGTTQGLMTVTTSNNSVSGPNLQVPGNVLSVSPDGSTVVVTDPVRQTVSLYSPTSGSVSTSTGGVGTRAAWTPDSQTVYITTTTNTLLTHSAFTNWQSTTANEIYTDAVVTVPSVGAYFAGGTANATGVTTDGRSYCASSVQSPTGTPPSESNTFAPLADTDPAITDRLAATNVGQHILGAHSMTAAGASTFSDLQLTLPTAACPLTVPTTYFSSTPTTLPIVGTPAIQTTTITGVFPTSGQVSPLNNQIAFVTYTGTGAQLPQYTLPSTGTGTLSYVLLTGTATAPISGVWSTDNTTFYTGTSGDNEVHEITQTCASSTSGPCIWKDSGQLTPNLPAATGTGTAPVNLIAQHPKRVTS